MSEAIHYSYSPVLISFVNWKQKEHFLLEKDSYAHWVVFMPLRGKFHFQLGNERGIGQFGDLIVCPPGVVLFREIITPLTFHSIRFHWRDQLGQDAPVSLMPAGKLELKNKTVLATIYKRMQTANSQQQWLQKKQGKLTHHLKDIWYLYFEETEKAGVTLPFSKDGLMLQVREHLAKIALESLCLKSVAAQYYISPSQLSKRFKKTFGMTPIEYITLLRLEKAKKLLLETNQPLDWIAEQCGYPNGYYLNRVFTKNLQQSPGYFRKNSYV